DHLDDSVRVLVLPADHEQVRIDLAVEYSNAIVWRRGNLRSLVLRLPLHRLDKLETLEILVRAVRSECHDLRTQICHVIDHAVLVCLFQDVMDEVDRRLRARMNLLSKIPSDQLPKALFALDCTSWEHFLLLHWETGGDRSEARRVGRERG